MTFATERAPASACGYMRHSAVEQAATMHLATKRSEEDDPDLTRG
jgi:hypothetical protein